MDNSVDTLGVRETYTPSGFTKFLWWLSTAEKEIIQDCTVDRNRYAITGGAVLCTWLFATLAWTYFFSTVVDDLLPAVLLGIFMGFIILSIDRALIKGITSSNKTKTGPIIFRLALALTIGTFMAQPALLYLFNKEVHVQISLDNEKRKMAKQAQLDSLYNSRELKLKEDKINLQKQLDTKYAEVSSTRDAFIAETDGTGGSGKIGLKDIARAKQNEYLKTDSAYQQLTASIKPQINGIDSTLASIQIAKQNEMKNYDALMNDGFLTRIEALNNLVKSNSAAQFRYYLLIAILVLIELMPVIAKSLLPNGTYDEKVKLREKMEKDISESNTHREKELKETYNQLAFEQDKEFMHDFFEEAKESRKNKMKEELKHWKQYNNRSFDKVWQQLKKDVLTRQEN